MLRAVDACSCAFAQRHRHEVPCCIDQRVGSKVRTCRRTQKKQAAVVKHERGRRGEVIGLTCFCFFKKLPLKNVPKRDFTKDCGGRG